MTRRRMLAAVLLVAAALLCSCQIGRTTAGTGSMRVVEQSQGPGLEDTETIYLDNCDGRADLSQVAERGQTVQVEAGADLGVGIEVIKAAISSSYATGSYTSKSIQLTAPPGTHMYFNLRWNMTEQAGIVAGVGAQGVSVAYRRFAPIDVQVVEQGDLGDCGTTVAADVPSQPASDPGSSPSSSEPPAAPVPEDTPPDTILQVGQLWRQDGWELQLVNRDVDSGVVLTYYRLTNLTANARTIRYGYQNFTSEDNLGNRLETAGIRDYGGWVIQYECESVEVTVQPGSTVDLDWPCSYGNWSGVLTKVDTVDPSITKVIITVSGISTIEGARWEIPLYH